ncbi:MAG TPA: BRCT domain-containing protein [Kofleriaceae bacterium]|nr:BRCT domain-containing protein [Kofleriaceae bacterium]
MAKRAKATPATSTVAGKKFLFTGKLAAMTRAQASSYVEAAGGKSAGSVSKDLDYLVIGDDGSFLYGAGTKGEKTLAAEKLIANGAALQIISETQFLALVKAPPPAAPAKPKIKTGPVKQTAKADGTAFEATGKKFMFTGKLAAMSRSEAAAKVLSIGGINAGSVSKDLDYLVVGDQGSPLFGAGAKGDKILTAEKLIAQGLPLQIIAESAFLAMADGSAPAATKRRATAKRR